MTLGIDSSTVDHPAVMTERLCSPLHSRSCKWALKYPATYIHVVIAVTSELMFEQYSVPSLAYCVDSLMSFYHNNEPYDSPFLKDGLVVSFNTASTSIVPILGGKGIMSRAKR